MQYEVLLLINVEYLPIAQFVSFDEMKFYIECIFKNNPNSSIRVNPLTPYAEEVLNGRKDEF